MNATQALMAALAVAGFLLTGCASVRGTGPGVQSSGQQPSSSSSGTNPDSRSVDSGAESEDSASAWEPHAVVIVDGFGGTPVRWDEFVDAAAQADVVFFGEIHGHPRVQAVMAEMFADIVARTDGNPALSLEFFERDEQVAIDDYLTGVVDEVGFEKAAHRTPQNYPSGHRRMLETAREQGFPVVASNAPRRYAKLARTEGYERLGALTDIQRSLFVIPEALTGGAYWDRFAALMIHMQGHEAGGGAGAEELARTYFRAQNLWDATMADSIVQALTRGYSPVVHVVGKFHVEYNGGLVQRVHAAEPNRRLVTVTFVEADGSTLRDEEQEAAQYVFYVGQPDESATRR